MLKIKLNPKGAWDSTKLLKDVHFGHHTNETTAKICDTKGSIVANYRGNASNLESAFTKF